MFQRTFVLRAIAEIYAEGLRNGASLSGTSVDIRIQPEPGGLFSVNLEVVDVAARRPGDDGNRVS